MGNTVKATIAFGIQLEEGAETPWNNWDGDEHNEREVMDWWKELKGFKTTHQPWTNKGEYAAGWTRDDPRFIGHYEEIRTWEKANPAPFEEENCCCGDYHIGFITHPSFPTTTAYRGETDSLDFSKFQVSEEQVKEFKAAIKEHLGLNDEPEWHLFAYSDYG